MGDVGHEVAPHLLEAMQARDIAGHHQAFIVAVQGDLELQDHLLVDGGVQCQGFAIIASLKVVDEAWIAQQVGDVLAAVMGGLQSQHAFGGTVPPFHVAMAVEHDHAVAHRLGGFLDPPQGVAQASLGNALALLVAVEAIEQLAPQPRSGRRLIMRMMGQPFVQGVQLAQLIG